MRSNPRRIAAFALATLVGASPGLAQQRESPEIAPFRLTGYDGYVQMGYIHDGVTSRQADTALLAGGKSVQTQSQWRTEVFLNTRSYVYHPSFLALEIGGGPVLDETRFDTDGSLTRSDKALYNLSARASVLRDKPYRGSVFYEHLNPTQSVGPAQVLLTETSRYGMDFALLAPATPVPVYFEASSSDSKGRSTEQTLDDRIDQFSLRASAPVGKLGSSQWRFQGIRQESQSGSAGLPILATRSNTENFNADTRLRFGARNEYDLTNTVTYNDQRFRADRGTLTNSRDWRFDLDLRGQHTDALNTFARYGFTDSRFDEQTNRLNTLSAGGTYRASPELNGSLSANADFSQTTQTRATLAGVSGSANYRQALPFGTASASYGLGYAWRDQSASALQGRVVGERISLAGAAFASLSRPQVIEGSVLVRNTTLSQTYLEGLDYALSVVGLTTRLQRLVGGNIVDGQELLVDYAYDVGGTYALSQVDQSASLTWSWENRFSTFARFSDSRPTLASGAPTFDLNPARTLLYGLRADLPLSFWSEEVTVGGSFERERRDEVVSPGRRTAWEAYVQAPLPWFVRGEIRLGTRRSRTEYDLNPEQAQDLSAYDFRISTRPGYGFDLSLDGSHERDTGTALVRTRTYLSAKARWRIRQFRMTFDLNRTHDAQGEIERTRTAGTLLLRRDF